MSGRAHAEGHDDFDFEPVRGLPKMLPPGDSAYGFFYFQTGHSRGTSLYISGIREAQSGKELFYFEIPLD